MNSADCHLCAEVLLPSGARASCVVAAPPTRDKPHLCPRSRRLASSCCGFAACGRRLFARACRAVLRYVPGCGVCVVILSIYARPYVGQRLVMGPGTPTPRTHSWYACANPSGRPSRHSSYHEPDGPVPDGLLDRFDLAGLGQLRVPPHIEVREARVGGQHLRKRFACTHP